MPLAIDVVCRCCCCSHPGSPLRQQGGVVAVSSVVAPTGYTGANLSLVLRAHVCACVSVLASHLFRTPLYIFRYWLDAPVGVTQEEGRTQKIVCLFVFSALLLRPLRHIYVFSRLKPSSTFLRAESTSLLANQSLFTPGHWWRNCLSTPGLEVTI